MITRDDLSITRTRNGTITVAGVVNGYRVKLQYIGWSEDDAVAEFLSTLREDAS